jgi:hypothetical protein
LEKGIKFLKALEADAHIDIAAFESTCGVGVVVTDEEIEKVLLAIVAKHKIEDFKKAQIWQGVKKLIPFADKYVYYDFLLFEYFV